MENKCEKCGYSYMVTSADFKPFCRCSDPEKYDVWLKIFAAFDNDDSVTGEE